jgi:hypothetical protein
MIKEVYWIHTKDHSDIFSEGYIGVSNNAKTRWKSGHQWQVKNNMHPNIRLTNAINEHGWNNLVMEVILIADSDYCHNIEQKLRPSEEIGWNLAIGGGKPPIAKFRGEDYVSPLKGVSRSTPWMIGRTPSNKGVPSSKEACAKMSVAGKGRKQTLEQIAKRVASRSATLLAQGRTV